MIKLQGVCKEYDSGAEAVVVLQDFSLAVGAGELLAITGPSGCGKSTLLHIMGGLDQPTAGNVYFEEQDIYAYSEADLDSYRNRNIGFVFQFHYLLNDFTALENVMVPAMLGGVFGDNMALAKERALMNLERVGLSARVTHYPYQLSGGEQQRVAIARALMNAPKLILADEPTGNLDKWNSENVQEILFGLKDDGISVVVVTHDAALANRCDREIQMRK